MERSRILSGPVGRRRFLVGLTGAAAALGLTACGVSASEGTRQAGRSVPPGGGATRGLVTDNGTIQVPENPQRIVVLANYEALMLLDLGLVPVGIPDGTASEQLLPPEVYARLKDVPTIGAAGTPNAQAIAALKPDLIIDQFYKDKSAALTTIAPVAYFDWASSRALWHEQIAKVAKAVNRETVLAEKKTEYERRLAEVKAAYAKQIASTTWAPLSGGPNGKFFLGTPLATVMRDVGLRIGAGLPENEAGFVPKSYEEMDVLDGCDALIYPVQFDGKPTPTTQQLLDHKLWKGVPAVKAGHAFSSKHFVMANYSFAISTVDEIEGMLKQL
ncbi:ABC transporter substrate-binding protein [Nonomuraea sp. NPDC059023]|uniref:ABC transporter substrate-binding protein n=1 Tax=Nonomuraea sp. NPDC059023 TaxID=3346706 RepID=UPI003675DCCF